MLDLILRGGRVVTPTDVGKYDVGIKGETIAVVAPTGSLETPAREVIDVADRVVVPGGVDPHIHAQWPIPALSGEPTAFSAGPEHVSRAALFGGTTTWIDFATWAVGTSLQETLEAREAQWAGKCYSDYAFHVMIQGDPPREVIDQIPEAIQAGHPSFKVFTTDITPSRRGRKLRLGDIWEVLNRVARYGGITAVHAEDDDLVMHMYARLARENRMHFANMAEVHSSLSEDLAFRRIIRLAESVEGAAIYFMHVSAQEGVHAIAEAQDRRTPVYGETLHNYALFTSEAYQRPNGQMYHTYPSLKGLSDQQELWRGMLSGAIRTIATDGICTPLKIKTLGARVDDVTGGHAGVEARMGVVFTEAVVQRGYSLGKFVDLTSANAARLFGLYPRKGAIQVGSDADIVAIDPNTRRKLRATDLHEADYSPWDGWDIAGWPVLTLLRGSVVAKEGTFVDAPAQGQLIPRKVADDVRTAPH